MTNSATATEAVQGETIVYPYSDLGRHIAFMNGPDGVAIVGSRCSDCKTTMVGPRDVCNGCVGQDLQQIPLGPQGILYSYTTLHVSPLSPQPFTLGYVDLDQGARILSVIEGPIEQLSCDLRVVLVTDGETWSFVSEPNVA